MLACKSSWSMITNRLGHRRPTVPDCAADDAVRAERVFDFRPVHPDAQIPLERGNCNSIRGFTTSLHDLGTSQPCCDDRDDENSKHNAFSDRKSFYNLPRLAKNLHFTH